MKNSFIFFSTVLALLLASAIVLTGCMYAISAENGAAKVYDMGSQINTDNTTIVDDDTPTSQTELQKKFSEMYDISKDGKTITVISEDYLNKYWQSNYEKEVIHSLTIEEIYFIIQDSIRIYEEYDEVVLTGFASITSIMQVAERFPFVEDKVIKAQPDAIPYYEWDDTEAIYEIILYRLKALSSPKAFFTGDEAIRFVGEDPMCTDPILALTTFYIPNYSENTDRDTILEAIGLPVIPNIDYEPPVIPDLFRFCNICEATISFITKSNNQSTKVYPTEELDNKMYPHFSIKIPELNNALLEHRQDYKVYIDGEYLCGGVANGFEDLILKDITGDGTPELCFVMNFGIGMMGIHISIFDYKARECIFSLSDRFGHDYELFLRDGLLCVLETEYMSTEITRTGVLTYDGSNIYVSWDAEVDYPYDWPEEMPIDTQNQSSPE